MARKHKDILLLIDPSRSRMAADLDVLYPDRVERVDYTKRRITAASLAPYTCVITQVADGSLAPKLNFRALTAYARQDETRDRL